MSAIEETQIKDGSHRVLGGKLFTDIPFPVQIINITSENTMSIDFVDIPGASFDFNLPSPANALITASGRYDFDNPFWSGQVRLMIDGAAIPPNHDMFDLGDGGGIFSFHHTAALSVGAHIVKLQFNTASPSVTFTISNAQFKIIGLSFT